MAEAPADQSPPRPSSEEKKGDDAQQVASWEEHAAEEINSHPRAKVLPLPLIRPSPLP